MKVRQIGKRNFLFTFDEPGEWELNAHLIKGEKINYLIDTGLGSAAAAAMAEFIGTDKPLIIINTHHHWDHVWGNDYFRGNTIVAGSLCSCMMQTKWEDMLLKHRHYLMGETALCLPNTVFDDTLYFSEDGIMLFATPGHTADGISVLDEKDKILNAGDNIGDTMDEIVPGLEDIEAYKKTLDKYLSLDFNLCVSGHNVPLKKGVFETIQSLL